MLSTDEIILKILRKERENGNPILERFKIMYPKENLAEESNYIMVACVSAENNLEGLDFTSFKDLVEIVIITKIRDNEKAIQVIKGVSTEICRVLLNNRGEFPNKPVIRNINPYFNADLVLTRGQIMIQVNTEPFTYELSEANITNVCRIIDDENDKEGQ